MRAHAATASGTSIASEVASSPSQSQPSSQGGDSAFSVTLGGAYIPLSPGPAKAGLLQLEEALRLGKGDVRFGALGAYESTYFQSSVSVLATARQNIGFGSGLYALGYGVGLGYGSYSPTGSYHADSGGSGMLALIGTPVLLRFGPHRRFEVGLDGGITYLFAWSELDPLGAVTVGYVTW